jgi:hypothetical protein
MSAALAPAFIVAALVLCVSGALKLRSASPRMRVLAVGELALGTVCAVHPTRALALAVAVLYLSFAAVAAVLRRRRAACGCFGENDFPVTLAHVIASELLGTLAAVAAVAGPRGFGWVFAQPAPTALVLAIGVAGAVYATVFVYTVVPRAWAAWDAG